MKIITYTKHIKKFSQHKMPFWKTAQSYSDKIFTVHLNLENHSIQPRKKAITIKNQIIKSD